MRSPLWTAAMLGMTCLMAGCGGGGSDGDKAIAQSTVTTCSIPLGFVSGSSGVDIPVSNDWSPLVTDVSRRITDCNLRTIQSVRMELCLSPSGIIQELEARLLPPNGNVILVNLQSIPPGAACLTGGTLFSIEILPSDLPPATTLTGDWRLFVRDFTANNINGYFVGWSFTMTGLK